MSGHPPSWHVVFAGGGTGGHLFPGLAVAEQLRQLAPGTRVTFAGCGKPLEQSAAAAAGYDYLPLPCRPLPRRPRDALRFVLDNVRGYREAIKSLRRHSADVVVGLGGYVSVPMARAAVSCGVPLVLLEQNAVPGRVTRWLARHAALVCTSFAQTRGHLQAVGPVRMTGNPVRRGFHRSLSGLSYGHAPSKSSARVLLVMGGSLGARTLNEAMPKALHRLGSLLDDWQVVHQTGHADASSTQKLYHRLCIAAQVTPFLSDLPRVLNLASLAICRAGGTTLAELAAAGVPALLVPYPQASDDHQRRNAEVFCAAGAARLIDPHDASGDLIEPIAAALGQLLADDDRLALMSAAMRRLARPDAAFHVATLIRDLALRGAVAA